MQHVENAVSQVLKHLNTLEMSNKRLLLAVSGGADSMALAYLVSRAIGADQCHAITVDHGFREESVHEAQSVSQFMKDLGIKHTTRRLEWNQTASTHKGDEAGIPRVQKLEEVARTRRYRMISQVCQETGSNAVLTGHHMGDQAETFLLRFLRNSGIYGLAGMAMKKPFPHALSGGKSDANLVLVRPLLGLTKDEIYGVCKSAGIAWHEDRSNVDLRFRRNRIRNLLSSHSGVGNSPLRGDEILRVCTGMQRHRKYINQRVYEDLKANSVVDSASASVEISHDKSLTEIPQWMQNEAIFERTIAALVLLVNGNDHPPELVHIRELERAFLDCYLRGNAKREGSMTATAGITLVSPTAKRGWLVVRQAPRAGEILPVEDIQLGETVLWDNRLFVSAKWADTSAAAKERAEVLGDCTWCIYSAGHAERLWGKVMVRHRKFLKRIAKGARAVVGGSFVQVTMPVVCVAFTDGAGERQVAPVYALGHVIKDERSSPLSAQINVEVASVRSLEDLRAVANDEVFLDTF